MYVAIFTAGFLSAVLLLFLSVEYTREYRKKTAAKKSRKKEGERKKVRIDTFTKAATTVVILHGLIMVTMSYVLAWFDKDAVVDVSTTLITEIVAPLCLYIGTNCIANIFEKNELAFSKPISMQKVRDVWDKTHMDGEDELQEELEEHADESAG